jgi:hypothetical protein
MAVGIGTLSTIACAAIFALACSRGGAERPGTPPAVAPTGSAAVAAPAVVSAAPSVTPSEPPPDAFELRRREVRRIIAKPSESPGVEALRLADVRFLGELVVDTDPVLANAAVTALSTFGEPGLTELERAREKLSTDAASERRLTIDAHIAASKRARPETKPRLDPFEQPPRGTKPNCGPDERKHFVVTLESTADFVEFLRTRGRWLDDATALDNFRSAAGAIDWTRVAASTQVSKMGNRTVYALRYAPRGCLGFDLRMTNDGFTSLYGCCGK